MIKCKNLAPIALLNDLIKQKLRTVRVRDRSPDKVSDGLIRQVTLEVIPGRDQAAGAFDLQV